MFWLPIVVKKEKENLSIISFVTYCSMWLKCCGYVNMHNLHRRNHYPQRIITNIENYTLWLTITLKAKAKGLQLIRKEDQQFQC